jgi:hypothetical protein
MNAMFCGICGVELVKEQRVEGDPALDCGGDCAGCIVEVEMETKGTLTTPRQTVINRRDHPDIYDVLAEVYGATTAPLPSLEISDLQPLDRTPDGTPI